MKLLAKLSAVNTHRAGRVLAAAVGGLVAVVGVLGIAWAAIRWEESRLPETYNVMDFGAADLGAGPSSGGARGHGDHSRADRLVRLTALKARSTDDADYEATLTARQATVRLASGKTLAALTFDGRVPGPELRVRRGDLVEVTLENSDIEEGVSIHWHGVHVPNAEDGVAGVTQNAVLPGKRYTYRFRADQEGTFWYHSHQASAKQVKRGLYGALVILPSRPQPREPLDLTVVAHTFSSARVLGNYDTLERRAVPPGRAVRLRVINTDSFTRRFVLAGTPFRVVAIDGTDLAGPTPIRDRALAIAGGGRYDLAFTMPRRPVKLHLLGARAGLALSPDGKGDLAELAPGPELDPAGYGTRKRLPFDASSKFDRRFVVEIDKRLGFRDGRFGHHWAVNGKIYPDMPTHVVAKGDLVKMTFVNRSGEAHPMHLHGHHMLVLERDGERIATPWWSDTLNVEADETYTVAFRADNPGIWMDHCHNLEHAAEGLVLHLAYEGVTTPFEIGGAFGNDPE